MSRTIDAATITALQSDSLNMANLIQLDFGTVFRVTDSGRTISAMGETFISSDAVLDIDSFTETSDIQVNSATLTFSGVSTDVVGLFLAGDYIGVRARVWKAVMDNTDTIIGSPILIFDGRINGYAIGDTEDESTVQVDVSSHWKDFELTNGRKTNSNTQQLYFSGDKGFDFAPETAKDLKWGKQ